MEVLEDGDMRRISKVSLQVCDRASACYVMLNEATHRSHHSEPAVCDLFGAQSFLFFCTLGHAHGIEKPSTRVSDIGASASTTLIIWIGVDGSRVFHILPAADFSPVHQEHLHDKKSIGVGYIAIEERSLGPVRQRTVDKWVAEYFGRCHTGDTQHCPSGMHELGLLIPLQSCFVFA